MDLYPSKEARQLAKLSPFRTRHNRILIDAGIGRRILDSRSPVNTFGSSSEFSEATLLYPTRKKLGNMTLEKLCGIPSSFSDSCSELPQSEADWQELLLTQPDAFAIQLGRVDADGRGGYSQTVVFAGVQLDRSLSPLTVLEFKGIEKADASEFAGMLDEVDSYRSLYELSCLDEETLINTSIMTNGTTPLR